MCNIRNMLEVAQRREDLPAIEMVVCRVPEGGWRKFGRKSIDIAEFPQEENVIEFTLSSHFDPLHLLHHVNKYFDIY